MVVGGTSVLGGRGNTWRTVLGVLFLGLIVNGFNLIGVDPIYQQIVGGDHPARRRGRQPLPPAMSSVPVMIPPKSGYALRVGSGQVVRIIDVEGMQVADVVAYDATDPSDHLSHGPSPAPTTTRSAPVGDRLYSNLNAPLLTVVEDSVGVHDILFPL